jgi:Leucine-rich repeat (LRR) protein
MDQNYILRVKQPVETVITLVRERCGDDSILSLTGNLTQMDWRWLEPDTYTVVEYSEYTRGVTIKLTSHNCEALAKSVLPRVGPLRNVHEVIIAKGGEIIFAAYDNFYPQLTIVGPGVKESLLQRLVSLGLLHCYYSMPKIDDGIIESTRLYELCHQICAALPQVENVGRRTRGYMLGARKVAGQSRVVGLGLHGLSIERVPRIISYFEHLSTLSLTGNRLDKLGKFVTRCERLERLYASHNLIAFLPAGLRKLRKLKELDLSNNQLTNLPCEFGDLTSVEILNLSTNRLSDLPVNFSNLASLQYLDIRDNPLTDFTKKVLRLMARRGCQIII